MRELIERLEERAINEGGDVGIDRMAPKIRGLQTYMRGRAKAPQKYTDWHEELARESLEQLKKRFGIKVTKAELKKGPFGPLHVLHADIVLKDGRKTQIRWAAGLKGGTWSIKLKHGWGSAYADDFDGSKER